MRKEWPVFQLEEDSTILLNTEELEDVLFTNGIISYPGDGKTPLGHGAFLYHIEPQP